MTIWELAVVSVAAATLLIMIACIRISADRPGKRRRGLPVLRFLLMALIFLWFFAIMAIIVAVLLSDRLDVIRLTKDTALPETVKAWIWGWR